MILKMTYRLRLASYENLMPIENAAVYSEQSRQAAMKKTGGYYIFTEPFMNAETLIISCGAHRFSHTISENENASALYLAPKGFTEKTHECVAMKSAAAGEDELLVSLGGTAVPVLENCNLKIGESSAKITECLYASGFLKLRLSSPLEIAVKKGQRLVIAAPATEGE